MKTTLALFISLSLLTLAPPSHAGGPQSSVKQSAKAAAPAKPTAPLQKVQPVSPPMKQTIPPPKDRVTAPSSSGKGASLMERVKTSLVDLLRRGGLYATLCGNRIVESGEECDDGNGINGDGCSLACAWEVRNASVCGNKICEVDEDISDRAVCRADCHCSGTHCDPAPHHTRRCGDAVVEGSEECDDGNTRDGDGCSRSCRRDSLSCGNGFIEEANGEECDDGNTADGDGCNHECHLPCRYTTPLTCPSYWTHVIPADLYSTGWDIALDADDNVYVAGTIFNYDSSISPASQGGNIYLTKYDKCGNFRWSHVINSSYNPFGNDNGYGVATDADRNVYLTGDVSQAAMCLPAFIICPYDNILIRKYDACGGELWSRYYAGAFDDRGRDIALDGLGNVYVVGGADADLISSPHRFFVGKYSSSDGTPAGAPWPLSLVGAGGSAWAQGVATDAGGNIFVVGTTTSTPSLTTSSGRLGGDLRSNIWIFKFRPDGTLDPAFGGGSAVIYDGGGGDNGNGIALDSTGNIYVAAGQYFSGFSPLWIGKFDSIGALVGDPFPLTYSTYGEGDSIAIDGEGNLYVAGRANGRGIVLKYNASGSVIWVHNSSAADYGNFYNGISVGSDGSVYVTGNGVRAGVYGIWIRKYAPDGTSDDGPPDVVGP